MYVLFLLMFFHVPFILELLSTNVTGIPSYKCFFMCKRHLKHINVRCVENSIRCKIFTFCWHSTGGAERGGVQAFPEALPAGEPRPLACKVGMGDLGLRWEQTGKMVAENASKIAKLETRLDRQEAREDKLERD